MKSVFVFLFCCVFETLANGKYLYNEVEPRVEFQCIQHCPLQNRTDVGHYDYACDYNCNIDQCAKGCKLWRKALNSSCQKTCNGTADHLNPKQLYCVMGCNDALTKYFSQLRVSLGVPPPPALLADSLNATSLKLEWKFPEAKRAAGLNCHVQWKYEELAASWQYCRNVTWNREESNFLVEGLQPYTKYRFRIALNLGHHGEPIVSTPSVVISTLASGLPASPPTNDISPDNSFYMFRNLKSARNYTIDIRMRNNNGNGPAAITVVSTPVEPQITDNQQPILILGTEYNIFELAQILGEPMYLYHSRVPIKGVATHINKKLLFVSDSAGYVWKMPVEQETNNKTHILFPHSQIDFMPLDLSVDWLNDQLYILGEVKNQGRFIFKRCNLDGTGLTVAYAALYDKPTTIQIDPYNGYLFWTIQGSGGGLFRLDISDISNGIKHEVQVKKILNETDLGAFLVDHTNFRLLVSYQSQNTINAVSLDGKEIANLRPKVINSKLRKVISLVTANKKFYWTDGDDIFNEEYHQAYESYFHNKISHLLVRHYKKIFINLPSAQPWPIPVNPPTNVQAIFGRNIAKTRWHPPHLLGVQGKGAWQNWSYKISVKDVVSGNISTYNTNTTSFTIFNLNEDTEYVLKVAAYTNFGRGPWSSEFKGVTLNADKNPILFWSGGQGFMKSNAAGEGVETIIENSQMMNFHFTDISWFKDQIYLVTNNSHVHWYNLTSHQQGRLTEMDSVGSIAVDWIGKKLYWSNPKQQLIIRGNLNGTQQEPLPIFTLAKELNIDSVKAYLYWSTEYVVECAHFNGAERMEYHHVELFSGKQVMGLTLDMDQKFVYWIVRGSDGSNLFKAPMAGYDKKITVEKVSLLQKPNMHGPLCYFHKRLLWLQDERNAAISDLSGKNIATVSGKNIWGLTMVYVVDDTLHMMPEELNPWEEVNVIPKAIDQKSVKVVGSSDSFNVTWSPIENVNYGTVFYEIQIDSLSRNDSSIRTKQTSVKYWREVAPFTPLSVAIRAFTYWGNSPQVRVDISSPPSTPSMPRNLRTYVVYANNDSITDNNYVSLTFRWDPPLNPNGVLQGYLVRCWYFRNDVKMDICGNTTKPPNATEHTEIELKENEIYYFQVQAFTEIGTGKLSEPISVNSSQESPLPVLLVASSDSIFIEDIDAHRNQSLIQDIASPIAISYLIKENRVFWVNKLQELLFYDLDSLKKTKIFDIEGKPKGLTIDWLERSLFYLENPEDTSESIVYKIDLNQMDHNIIKNQKILFTSSNISRIEISPYTKKLYWTQTEDGVNYRLMQSNTDGTDVNSFFSVDNRNKRDISEEESCNCSYFGTNVKATFAVDHSNVVSEPSIIFIDSNTGSVNSADKDGCFCNIIANNILFNGSSQIEKVKSDLATLYWINQYGLLYALKRKDASILTRTINAQDILIFGQHMQPYPPKECLTPQQEKMTVGLLEKSSNSLNLIMPEFSRNSGCLNTSMATVMYTVFYKEDSESCLNEECRSVMTFEEGVVITDLKPFTNYSISIAVSNHFTKTDDILIGPPVVYQTAPGAPSKPRNVSATVLHPTLVKVNWLPPKELNGVTIHYEIYWLTEVMGVGQKGGQTVKNLQYLGNDSEVLTTLLHKLSPNKTYTVWVKACSVNNETFSESDPVQITTYPEPTAFTLLNETARSLTLSWELTPHIEKYVVEYTPITNANEWTQIKTTAKERNNSTVLIEVDNLKPKTQYKFRLSLLYEKHSDLYVWPSDFRFTFETLGDRPSPPGIPIIQYVKPNIYKVWWEASKENGAPIDVYKLEGVKLRSYRDKRSTNRTAWYYAAPSIEEEESEWETFYNGTETSCIINGLSDKYKYAFRVSAFNSYGWSDYSIESTEFDLNEAARISEKQSPMTLIMIATCVPVLIVLAVVTCFAYAACYGKCGKQKKSQLAAPKLRGPDVELATLRELPRRGVHSTNILYVSTMPTPEEITMLPHIRRDQITLTKFLGSGAFGEVFEGKAKVINGGIIETKVAVKTLKKGASDQEKSEFLQEAQLMSHFKHEHILQLLGVCLDNDPHFIIMELMQGGDLLTYLRDSRNPSTNTPSLSLIELLKMCVDVSKGCRYLEEMHFVHRDLACRNCLVSSVKTESRIVKIGDFGLARDIYKNDYYRKEGEGLLPVRWMAPESLVDGVFTNQSDVWAFGVLLWEILTLGQQPYPARNNLEVLHYVRRGGRLGKPTDCPEDLHKLMLKCWEFEPEKRPTFKYCLDVLENLHSQNLRNPTTAAHEGQYISTVPERTSWKSQVEDEANKEKTPFLPKEMKLQEIPKYLELIYEPEPEPLENDGYEIPNKLIEQPFAGNLKKSKSSLTKSDSFNRDTDMPYSNMSSNGNITNQQNQ